MEFHLKKVLRALLLSTSEPLSIKEIQAVFTRYHRALEAPAPAAEGAAAEPVAADEAAPAPGQAVLEDLLKQVPSLLTATQIREAMDALAQELVEAGDVCRLMQGAAGFRLAVAPDYAEWVRLLRDAPKPLRLSQAALETLAIVAYRQPVTRAEIEAVRGVAADSALTRLLELELVFISGRAELPGRPIQYATTEQFLEFCGVRGLEELPATDVISREQLNEWIRRATQPETQPELLSDADVGLAAVEAPPTGPAPAVTEAAAPVVTEN